MFLPPSPVESTRGVCVPSERSPRERETARRDSSPSIPRRRRHVLGPDSAYNVMPVVRFFFSGDETVRRAHLYAKENVRSLEQFARSAPFGVLIRLNHARQVTIITSNNLRENVRCVKNALFPLASVARTFQSLFPSPSAIANFSYNHNLTCNFFYM